MSATTQNMTVTKGTQKVEVFEFATGDYSKFQFLILNLDGSIALLMQGTSDNDNWQLEVTDLDVTATIQDSDTLALNVGTLSYEFSGLNIATGLWEKLFIGSVTVSAASGGGTTPQIWSEGRIGKVNVLIDDVDPGVNYDIVIDSLNRYYLKEDGIFTTVGEVEYSANEHYTGEKWADGKKIYRRIVTSSEIASSGTGTVAHGITGIENLINIQGYAKRNSPLAIYNLPTKNIEVKVDATNITITNSEPEALTMVVVLCYTKSE
jgi:hypothetical protein